MTPTIKVNLIKSTIENQPVTFENQRFSQFEGVQPTTPNTFEQNQKTWITQKPTTPVNFYSNNVKMKEKLRRSKDYQNSQF